MGFAGGLGGSVCFETGLRLPDTPQPILQPEIEGDVLSFEMADRGDGKLRMSLTLLGDGVAELRFPNATVRIKPIRFERK